MDDPKIITMNMMEDIIKMSTQLQNDMQVYHKQKEKNIADMSSILVNAEKSKAEANTILVRVGNYYKDLNGIDAYLKKSESRLKKIEDRLDKLEAADVDFKKRIDAVEEDIKKLNALIGKKAKLPESEFGQKEYKENTAEYSYNPEYNGIEISFIRKPPQAYIDQLKDHGFRWSSYSSCWYTRKTDENEAFAKAFCKKFNKELSRA